MLGPLLTAITSVVVPRPIPARALSEEERLALRAVRAGEVQSGRTWRGRTELLGDRDVGAGGMAERYQG
jgi:hypothetical protein